MRPLTASMPKPMLPVAGKPLCAHTADAAVTAGTSELIFVVGYHDDVVREYFGDSYRGVPVTYAVQEEQLGTAHAVNIAREYLNDDFVVLNGDDLYDSAAIAALFEACPSVGAYRVDDPRPYGVFSMDDSRITGVVEKPDDPPSEWVNVGAYHFPADVSQWLADVSKSERGEYEITDVVTQLVENRPVQRVPVEQWLGVGRPWELLEANEWKLTELTRSIEGNVHATAELHGPVVVESGATVDAGVVIEGPVLIESDAHIGPNVYIRDTTLIESACHIGHGVEIKNSVVMQDTNVPHLSYVGDSILASGVNLGAGTQVANLRHDGEPVQQTVKGERVSTGRRKYGVVAGPGVKTGVNTSLAPGVVLSADTTTEPGEYVNRDR